MRIALAATLLLVPSLVAQQTPPTGAISGVAFDAVTGQPLAGAIVSLSRIQTGTAARQILPRMVTDGKGRFVFAGLEPSDQYFLDARRFGYESTRYGWTAPGQSLAIADIARITVAPGQWVDHIRIPLWRLASISGQVVDERAEPLVGVAVRAFTTHTVAGRPQIVGGPVVATDDRGMYRISGLSPGRYTVGVLSVQSTVLATTTEAAMVRPLGEIVTGGISGGTGAVIAAPGLDVDGRHRLAVTNFATPPPPDAGRGRAYPAQFHGGATTPTEGASIDVGYGAAIGGIDFAMRPVPAVRVSGAVEGTPAPGLLLRLMPAGAEQLGFGGETATTVLAQDGTFTFLNVPAGQYTLLAQASVMDFTTSSASVRLPDAPGFPAGGISVGSLGGVPGLSYLSRRGAPAPAWGRASVSVGSRDVAGVTLLMRPVSKIRGRFVFADGTPPPPPNTRLLIGVEPASGDPTFSNLTGASVAGDPTFPFEIDGLLGGRYLINRGFLSYGVVSVTWNGRDVTYTGFDGALGHDFTDVVVTLTDKRAEITGIASGPQGVGVAGVIAFPVDRTRWTDYGWEPPFFRTTRSGSSGAFRLDRLSAGEYFVIAVDAARVHAWTDARFLAAAAPLATRVSVAWGETKSVDVTVREVIVR